MIGIITYGASNVRSVSNAMSWLGVESCIVERPEQLNTVDAAILPGVGAFGPAMERLARGGFVTALNSWVSAGNPLLGICLGMQLLAKRSTENGEHIGLGIIDADVVRMNGSHGVRIPHVGWNRVAKVRDSKLLGERDEVVCYHVHSYRLQFSDPRSHSVTGVAVHGEEFPSIVEKDNVMGVQFHPEKSQRDGLAILSNFVRLVGKC